MQSYTIPYGTRILLWLFPSGVGTVEWGVCAAAQVGRPQFTGVCLHSRNGSFCNLSTCKHGWIIEATKANSLSKACSGKGRGRVGRNCKGVAGGTQIFAFPLCLGSTGWRTNWMHRGTGGCKGGRTCQWITQHSWKKNRVMQGACCPDILKGLDAKDKGDTDRRSASAETFSH